MRSQGFTLLEVIVAVVILAVGLSSLFTSEAAAIKMAQRARTTTIATLLARCKMGEIEERIASEGWPATDLEESDDCCEDAEREGFTCDWSVVPIILPELPADAAGAADQAQGLLGGATTAGESAMTGAAASGATTAGAATAGGALNNLGVPLSGNPADLLGAMGGGGDTGGMDPIASLVLQMSFPVMKPLIEAQVRRATVKVLWKEGASEQSFSVMQYIVNELPVLAADSEDEENAQPGAGGATGGGNTAGAPPGGTTTGGGSAGGGR